ncbi:MAG: DUF4931 domain-containing protein [Romboutsia sp.]
MNKLRIDSMTNDMVFFSENRSKRPIDKCRYDKDINSSYEEKRECPFCIGNENICGEETFRLEDRDGWLVKSVKNKFPILDEISHEINGVHEVMVDTYRHDGSFYDMSTFEFENLFTMYKDRYINLSKDNKIMYISIFKNFLRQAGASLNHPHSQIVSLPLIPPELEKELSIGKDYYEKNRKCLYENIIEEEINLNKRVIHNSKNFLVIVPSATKYTGEVRILFKEKIKFEDLKEIDIKELAKIFKILFENIEKVEGDMPFNLCIHTYPTNIKSRKYFNTHMHIIPRKYSFGGFELGTGMYVSSKKPEDLALKLKF